MCAGKWHIAAMVLGYHRPSKVECCPCDVSVYIDAAGEDDHARRVDGPAAIDTGYDLAVRDADVADLAIDAVCGVVDFSALNSEGGVARQGVFLCTDLTTYQADFAVGRLNRAGGASGGLAAMAW